MTLIIKKKTDCYYDMVALGEVMLRLDPGDNRIRCARVFNAWEGGGEYNVARGLNRCFGMKTAIITALVDNDIGYLIEDLILQGGVDTSLILWKPFDGIGRHYRNGLNFTERGFGIRGARGISDRANTAASKLTHDSIDWDELFGSKGVRWFHTGGIFAALSEVSARTVLSAVIAAKRHGTIVSYDLNYRPSLWKDAGGMDQARKINMEIVKYVDVLIGNEEDFSACLGFQINENDVHLKALDIASYCEMVGAVALAYPNIQVIATTLRTVHDASMNSWSALAWKDGEIYRARSYENLAIFDRVGGGDSFASGLIYGLMELEDIKEALEYGVAHGALAMTTPGDTSTARLNEVRALVFDEGARIIR